MDSSLVSHYLHSLITRKERKEGGYLKCSIRGANNELRNRFYKFVNLQLFSVKYKFVHFQLFNV